MLNPIERETEDRLAAKIDIDRLRSHVEKFADLNRYPGTDDQWEAAKYVENTLEEDGVTVDLETITAYTSVPQSATVAVTGPTQRTVTDAITTSFSANTPDSGISGELTFLESVEEDVSVPDVTDKIVITRGLPTPGKVQLLEDAGARAAIFQSPTPGHLHEMTVSPIWGTPSADNQDQLPEMPVTEIHHDDGEWIRELVAGTGVNATVTTTVRTELRELPCPVARVDGTDSDRYFVVGNHIDSWHEGVTDNGTAVAASMELARIFADNPPKRGVVFGFWPGHSMGRYAGSARYVDDNWLDLRENGVAYLHIDLNGLTGADQLWFEHMSEVSTEHRNVLEDGPLPLQSQTRGDGESLFSANNRPGRNSDQSFWGAGMSSLLSGARFSDGHEEGGPIGGGWWWHTPADTEDKVDYDLLAEELALYVSIVSRFCNSPVLPHDFRETTAEIRSVVEEIETDTAGNVDFSSVYDQLDTLEESLDTFTRVINDYEGKHVAAAIEDVQVELGNALIPALYMEAPPHEHDPALSQELLPYLRIAESLPGRVGPDQAFAEVKVKRGISKLASQLKVANESVTGFIDDRESTD